MKKKTLKWHQIYLDYFGSWMDCSELILKNLQLQLLLIMINNVSFHFLVFFSDPIDSIHLYSVRPEDIGDESKYIEHEDGEDVTIQAGDQFYFRCVARSSNPPANVRVLIGDRDITDKVPFEWVFSGIRESVDINIAFGISLFWTGLLEPKWFPFVI